MTQAWGAAQISGGKREDRLVPPCTNLHMNLEGFLSSLPPQIYMTKENISLRAAAPTDPTLVLVYLYIVLIVTNGAPAPPYIYFKPPCQGLRRYARLL